MLSIILSLLSSLWSSSFGRIVIVGGGLFLFGLYKGWNWAADGKTAAIAARDLQWQLKISEMNRNAENDANARVQAAIEAAAAVMPTPAKRDDLIGLCRKDKSCRDQTQYQRGH